MKKLSLLCAMLFLTALFAEEFDDCCDEEEAPPFYPFSITGTALRVASTHFRDDELIEHDHLNYHQVNGNVSFTYPVTEVWGLNFAAGYVGTEMKWKENPDFDETHFSYVILSLGTFTRAMPDWSWQFSVNALIDTAVLDLGDYALYQGMLVGQYSFSECLLFDAGFILEVGLNKGKIWPVLGFEFLPPSEKWALFAVFPLDISFEYYLFPTITVGCSARFLRDRHRVKEDEPLPMGIYEYRTTGFEFDLTFTPSEHFNVQGFVGTTFNGDLKITNRSNHHAKHFKFKGSPLAGVSAVLTF